MKKAILLLATVLFAAGLFAQVPQVPQGLSYQAVIRDANGNLVIDTTVKLDITIMYGNATTVYEETQTVGTNMNGLVSLAVGMGNPVTGSFAAIDWSLGNYYIQVQTAIDTIHYQIFGKTQLLSVPYALYAAKADTAAVPLSLQAGNGIRISGDSVINTAPNQPVTITGQGADTVTGTYPNFTVSTPKLVAGSGIQIIHDTIYNTVTIAQGPGVTITGTYPNFTVSAIPHGKQMFNTVGTSVFTVPVGVTQVWISGTGGGGGGGGGQNQNYGGAGGGGAAATIANLVSGLTQGNQITVTVGGGGAGGTVSSNNGNAGDTSSFGSYVILPGGGGGNGGGNSGSPWGVAGGPGGARGQGGSELVGGDAPGGNGGGTIFGSGGGSGITNPVANQTYGTGASGGLYGGGGGGGSGTGPSSGGMGAPGGAGASGFILVEW